MVDLITYIVKQLVDDTEAVQVTSEVEGNVETVHIRVADKDVGKVIGKQGKIATSIRTIARAVGTKDKKKYSIEIEND